MGGGELEMRQHQEQALWGEVPPEIGGEGWGGMELGLGWGELGWSWVALG